MAVEIVDEEARFGDAGRGCLLKAGGGLFMAVYSGSSEAEQYWYPDLNGPAVPRPYTIPEARWVRNAKALDDGTYEVDFGQPVAGGRIGNVAMTIDQAIVDLERVLSAT